MEMTAAGAAGPEFLTSHCTRRKGSVRTGTALGRPGLVSTESQSFQNPRPLPSAPCFQSPQPIPSNSPMYTRAHRHPQQRCHPGISWPFGGGRQGADRQADDGFTCPYIGTGKTFNSLCTTMLSATARVPSGRGSIGLLSNNAPSERQLMSIGASEHRAFSGQRRVSPAKRLRNTVLSVGMPFLPDILPCIVGGIFANPGHDIMACISRCGRRT